MAEKKYGIKDSDLKHFLDQYVMKSGETIDIDNLRTGIEKIVYENNEAMMAEIKDMIEQNKK